MPFSAVAVTCALAVVVPVTVTRPLSVVVAWAFLISSSAFAGVVSGIAAVAACVSRTAVFETFAAVALESEFVTCAVGSRFVVVSALTVLTCTNGRTVKKVVTKPVKTHFLPSLNIL